MQVRTLAVGGCAGELSWGPTVKSLPDGWSQASGITLWTAPRVCQHLPAGRSEHYPTGRHHQHVETMSKPRPGWGREGATYLPPSQAPSTKVTLHLRVAERASVAGPTHTCQSQTSFLQKIKQAQGQVTYVGPGKPLLPTKTQPVTSLHHAEDTKQVLASGFAYRITFSRPQATGNFRLQREK